MKPIRTRTIIAVVAGASLLFVAACVWVGGFLAAAVPSEPGPMPRDPPVEAVSFVSGSGSTIHGWYARGREGGGAIVLMHGVRANRTQLLPRARFLWKAGYSVLLFDFQAEGESPGNHITFGYLESRDVRAAVGYMRSRLPSERLGGLGTSLGGAATLIGPQPAGFDALVLEAVYPTFPEAVEDRIRIWLGPLAGVLAPCLLMQVRPRLGFSPHELRPIDGIPRVGAPVLIVAGAEDRHTTPAESRRLFEAARPPKEFWLVPGAAHIDFHLHAGAEYEKRILSFFDAFLRRPATGPRIEHRNVFRCHQDASRETTRGCLVASRVCALPDRSTGPPAQSRHGRAARGRREFSSRRPGREGFRHGASWPPSSLPAR